MDERETQLLEKAKDEFGAFYEEYPLHSKYSTKHIFGGDGLRKDIVIANCLPAIVRLYCPVCKITNPFHHRSHGRQTSWPNDLHNQILVCTGCEKQTAAFFLEFQADREWVRKIGQLPQWDISLDPDLEKALDADAEFYKRALICVGQSFGVGACTYLRRVLENRITPLLRLILENRKEDGAPPEELARIERIIGGRAADEKIKLAREVLPEALLVEGDNPLEFIYDELSAGLHGKDEQECTEIARVLLDPVRHVVVSLSKEREQRRERRSFGEKIRALRRGRRKEK